MGTGYYSFFSDLSRCENWDELSRISEVYKPVLGDVHNAFWIPSSSNVRLQNQLFDMDKIYDFLISSFFSGKNNMYFNDGHTREDNKTCMWGDRSCKWSELPDAVRDACAEKRASGHNKLIKYKASYDENIKLMNDFCEFCNKKNIDVYIVNYPVSRSYLKYSDPNFREEYYNALNQITADAQLIDLAQMDVWDDSDFGDMDHLNDQGAVKATGILKESLVLE